MLVKLLFDATRPLDQFVKSLVLFHIVTATMTAGNELSKSVLHSMPTPISTLFQMINYGCMDPEASNSFAGST
jgi:hypothetical protein